MLFPNPMNAMKHLTFLFSAAVVLCCQGIDAPQLAAAPAIQQLQAGPVPKHVDAQGADKLLKDEKGVVILDIRTPKEFAAGRIKGAQNIDFYAEDFAKKLAGLDKGRTYLVHCASGGRSTKSLEQFQKLGFKSVYHLDGGFKGWEKAGKPVER